MEESVFDTEHLTKTYFKMSLPVVLGLVVTLVYNLADTFFIAQTGDALLVAGVSLCAPVFTALMAFGNIYGQGGSSLISRLLGKSDLEGTKRVSSFCFYVALGTGLVLGALMLLFRGSLLSLLGAVPETLPHARDYYTVMAVGAPIVCLSFIHSNLVRCEGMASQSMAGSMLGTVVNIILDPILISGCDMGALGAAVATVIGYLCSDLYFLWLLKKTKSLSIAPGLCRVSGEELRQILGVGVTAALTNLMQSLTVIFLNRYLLPYGSEKIAAMGIVLKVNMIAQLVLVGFSFGGVPLFGYLWGGGKKDEMKKLLRFCLCFLTALGAALTLVLMLAAPALIGSFLPDSAIVADGTVMLRWQVAGTVFGGVVLLLTVLFQATGKVIPAFLLSVSRQGVVFLLTLLLGTALFGYTGILASQAAADVLSAVLAVVLYKRALAD